MARHRHKSHRRSHRHSKNFINKTVDNSMSVVKSTSQKYMPKVKTGLENVGSKVINTSKTSVPYLQRMTRKMFGLFSGKTRKHRRH
jgi:hypothetical protein